MAVAALVPLSVAVSVTAVPVGTLMVVPLCPPSVSEVVSDVDWGAWGGSRATGAGTAEYHGCTPSCAAARVHHATVAITLSNVRTCKGRQYYTHVALLEHSGKLLDASFSSSKCGTLSAIG